MDRKWQTGVVAITLVCLGLTGCVDDEPSVVIQTNLAGEGSLEIEEAEEEGEEDEIEDVDCIFPTELDDRRMWQMGRIDLEELVDMGQPLVREAPDMAFGGYMFNTVMENRLSDSRTVGAVSGGEGEGYENLELDKNDVMITTADVRLTYVGDEAQIDVDWLPPRRATVLVGSGGGVATYKVPILANTDEVRGVQGEMEVLEDSSAQHPFVAEIQLEGHTLGGNEVETNILEYPLTICDGCGAGITVEDGEFDYNPDALFTNPQCYVEG